MLVHIVYMPTADRLGPDLTRMGTVEEVPDEVGRAMLNDGSARVPSADEVAAFEQARAIEAKAEQVDDLTDLKKDELLELAEQRGVEVSESDTKPVIAKAVKGAKRQSPGDEPQAGQ